MINKNIKNINHKAQKTVLLFFALCLSLFVCAPVFAFDLPFGWSPSLPYSKKLKVYTPKDQYKYTQNILRQEEIEKFEKSLLPESGYMTREEYEAKSKYVPNSQKNVPEYKQTNDLGMKYVPQPIYKLARYNNPPGSPELHIGRTLNFDRQFTCPGITSPNKDILVYPVISYYAVNQCTSTDLFMIPLDKSFPDVERIQRANIVRRKPNPILSTDKSITEKGIFRTMTPIDFSPDGSKLVAKEKIGGVDEGIWKTNLWIYDFNTQSARQIPEVREAIKYYWKSKENLVLDEKRWDIYPMGFDAGDPNRVVVSAYGYTGKLPKFLGLWSIDCNGERSMLISLFKDSAPVSVNGYKLVKEGVVEPFLVEQNEKNLKKLEQNKKKSAKKAAKDDYKQKKKALNKKLKEMKKEENRVLHGYNKQLNSKPKPED